MNIFKQGRQQLIIKIMGKPTKKLELKESELERGRIRKAIEDRRIEKELLNQDLW